MSPKSKNGGYSGAVLRMQRDERIAAQVDPAHEAKRREASFLKNLTNARDDYDWIVANKAWTQLGYETHTEWYVARVHPLLLALGARPNPELAASILDHVDEDEADLAPAQRMTQAERAELSGLSRKTLSRRSQDRSQETLSPGADLGSTTNVDTRETSGLGSTSPDAESGENHQDGNPGEAEEFRGSPAADGVHPPAPLVVDDSSPEGSSTTDEPERAGAGVSLPAPVTNDETRVRREAPDWLVAITAVIAAVDDFAALDIAEVAAAVDEDLFGDFGLAVSKLDISYAAMSKRRNDRHAL